MSEFNHLLVSVDKHNIENTLIYNNVTKYFEKANIECVWISNNIKGLSEIYNQMLEKYYNQYKYIHFVHSDVQILDDWDRLCDDIESRPDWMITGVAGASKIEIKYPSLWNCMGDPKSFKGSLHHLTEDGKQYFSTPCGLRPARTALLDGVYLCINTELYSKYHIKFDEQFTFHHYDLDISLQAVKAGLKIGVGNFNIAHKSHGLKSLNDKLWKESNDRFLKKWQS